MINAHHNLVREVLPKIGSDAFTILLFIASHLGKHDTAWPGIKRIRDNCTVLTADGTVKPMSKGRVYVALKKLEDEKLISRRQQNKDGEFGKIIYRVTTEYIGIWNKASEYELEEKIPHTVIPEHGKPEHGKPESANPAYLSIDEEEVIDKEEVIGEREETPAPENPKIVNDYKPAYNFLITYLLENESIRADRIARAEFKRASIKPSKALEGYLNKLARNGEWFRLTVPNDENDLYTWIGRHLAGWESYMRSWISNEQSKQTATPEKPKAVAIGKRRGYGMAV